MEKAYETVSRIPHAETLFLYARYYKVSIDEHPPPDSLPDRSLYNVVPDSSKIQIIHHLKSKNIPIDFMLN